MNDEQADRFLSFLDAHHVMSLATAGPEGPHAANLFYARDGFALLWVSERTSRHSVHVERASRAAATIAPDYSDFREARGIQILGHAYRITEPAERVRAQRLIEARYGFLRMVAEAPEEVRSAYERADLYRLAPFRMVMIDNGRGFGAKDTIEFAPDQPT
jgi:uncharacterized protein YhbP (UPF0306 family)